MQVSAPTPQRGYTWTISFVSNPGYFPVNARDVADFTWDAASSLTGNGSKVNQSTLVEGSEPLSGTFQLGFKASPTGGLNTTDDLAYDISAGALEAALEALELVGDVTVERVTNADGYTGASPSAAARRTG